MHIEAQGLSGIQDKLKQLKNKTGNIKPLLDEFRNHLQNIIEESFENETSPDGLEWSPIKPRKNDPHPEKILYADGTLQGSLYGRTNKDSLTVGVNATSKGYQYPIVHQFGSTKESGRGSGIVARAFMPIKPDGDLYDRTLKELEEIIDDYFEFIEK